MNGLEAGGVQERLAESGDSAFRRYRVTATGGVGMGGLLYYELVTLLAMALPGTLGLLTRRILYRPLFRRMGRHVRIGRNVEFRRPRQIALGHHVVIGDDAIINAKTQDARIVLDDGVCLGQRTILSCNGGHMELGARTRVGADSRLGSLRGLSVGADVSLGEASCVTGAGHAYDRLDVPILLQPLTCRGPTQIGDGVHISDRATVRDGVSVGAGACVTAGSFVSTDVPAGSRVSGVPAREDPA